jgi:hypothetical protein
MAINAFTCTHSSGCQVARGDYRVNSGSNRSGDETGPGLVTNPNVYNWSFPSSTQNGICFQRSTVRVAQISDGTYKTAMLGEKYLNPNRYFDGEDSSDDQCVFTGHDRDNSGYTSDGQDILRPLRDEPTNQKLPFRFGGAHVAGFHLAFCDGSIHVVRYDIDDVIWSRYGGRDDEMRK